MRVLLQVLLMSYTCSPAVYNLVKCLSATQDDISDVILLREQPSTRRCDAEAAGVVAGRCSLLALSY